MKLFVVLAQSRVTLKRCNSLKIQPLTVLLTSLAGLESFKERVKKNGLCKARNGLERAVTDWQGWKSSLALNFVSGNFKSLEITEKSISNLASFSVYSSNDYEQICVTRIGKDSLVVVL